MDIFILFVVAFALIVVFVALGMADIARTTSEKAMRLAHEAQDEVRQLNASLNDTIAKQTRAAEAAERDRQDIMLRLSVVEGRQAIDDFLRPDLPDAKAS